VEAKIFVYGKIGGKDREPCRSHGYSGYHPKENERWRIKNAAGASNLEHPQYFEKDEWKGKQL
jgi:hypothetical protein